MLTWAWLLASCTPAGSTSPLSPTLVLDEEPVTDTGPSMPSPWTGTEEGGEVQAPDLDLVEATAQEGLELIYERGPGPIFEPYSRALSTRHDDCLQYSEEQVGQTTHIKWSGNGACSQPESSQFVGMVASLEGEDMSLDEGAVWPTLLWEVQQAELPEDFCFSGRFMLGQGYIWTPDDERFNGAGSLSHLTGGSESEGTTFWARSISGVFSWSGEVDEESWFTGDASLDWEVRVDRDEDDTVSVSLSGGITGLPETGGIFAADELKFTHSPSDSSTCADEPEGSLFVRTDDGSWVEVGFDAADGGACDGCGTAVWQESELGPVCLDVSRLYDWEDAPW